MGELICLRFVERSVLEVWNVFVVWVPHVLAMVPCLAPELSRATRQAVKETDRFPSTVSIQVGNEPEHSPPTKLSLGNIVSGPSSTFELLSTRRVALVDSRSDGRTSAVLVTYG